MPIPNLIIILNIARFTEGVTTSNLKFFFGRSTLLGQRSMILLSFVLLSVCLSVRPSLSFLKIGSLVSSDIVHDGSWP